MRSKREKGQAVLLLVVVMGILLVGALGLAIDASQLFAHQQMAQVAADAAAQAAMLSIFQGINNGTFNAVSYFGTSGAFDCTPGTDSRVPCRYARMNGFGIGSSDTVNVSFPACGTCSYGSLLAPVTPNQVKVKITRNLPNGFIRMIGAGALSTVLGTAVAATLKVVAPVPILIVHPDLSGSLSGTGTSKIEISGGPPKSIQVNSSARADAYGGGSQFIGTIDLSLAGPNGSGADFGIFGGPATAPNGTNWNLGAGKYKQPESPVADPLLFVQAPGAAPGDPVISTAPATIALTPSSAPNYGCADTTPNGCTLYRPGRYPNGISITHGTAIFQPGVYVMGNGHGFGSSSNGALQTCVVTDMGAGWPSPGTGCVSDPSGVTGDGMLIYNEGGGVFSITGGAAAHLKGTPETDNTGRPSRYAGILLFQDRTSPAANTSGNKHVLGGGGCIELIGTIYVTNTADTILASPGHSQYQLLDYHGNSCSGTFSRGMIITDALSIKGGADLKMRLNPSGYLRLTQVALVGGGPHY